MKKKRKDEIICTGTCKDCYCYPCTYIQEIKNPRKECLFFDGGTCNHDVCFPNGVPTEVGGSFCSTCEYYIPKEE